jgi:hypothetical protein
MRVFGAVAGLAQLLRQLRTVTDHADAHAGTVELGEVLLDRDEHQAHQERHLLGRALPVLGRERKNGEVLDAPVGAGEHRLDERVDPGLVAEHARQEALLRPSAVAVHDDGDVLRHGRADVGGFAHGGLGCEGG